MLGALRVALSAGLALLLVSVGSSTEIAAKSAPAKPAPAKGGDLASQFAAAAAQAKNLKERPDNDTMLKLYALYKQGAAGDVSGPRPGMFDFIGGAKYDAWAKAKGTDADSARDEYVETVRGLTGT